MNAKKVLVNMTKLQALVMRRNIMLMDGIVGDCENYAKHNAPWTDRTGNARGSIYGRVIEKKPDKIVGAVGIGMDYGVYLELAHKKKYKIIWPTIELHKSRLDDIQLRL